MATSQPPLYYFTGIQFNDGFFNTGTTEGGGITQSFADNAYLARNGSGVTSRANDTTFLGSLTATANANSIISKAQIAHTISTTGVTDATVYTIPFVPTNTTSTSQTLYVDSGVGTNHINYQPSTNTLSVGATTNGNITVLGTASTVSIAGTGTALSIPNGNVAVNTLSVSGVTSGAINIPSGGIGVGGSITLGGYINFPSTYTTVPSTSQLGGYSLVFFTAAQALANNTFKNLGSISLPAGGVYIINLSVIAIATSAVTLTRFVVEASVNNASFTNNISQNTQYGSWTLINTNNQVYTTSYTINTTVPTTVYGNCAFVFTGTMTGSGSISYTRIA